MARRLKKFHEDTSTSREVIDSNTLTFRPNFKFSRLKLLGGPPPLGLCTIKPWSISSACKKIEGAAPPKGRNVVYRKKVHYGLHSGMIGLVLVERCHM